MKTLEDEWYIVIKYKLSILEILRVCFVDNKPLCQSYGVASVQHH